MGVVVVSNSFVKNLLLYVYIYIFFFFFFFFNYSLPKKHGGIYHCVDLISDIDEFAQDTHN